MKTLALIILSLTLGACATNNPFNFPNMRSVKSVPTIALRASVGTMSSDLTATANVQKSRNSFTIEQDTIGDDGSAYRGDVSYVYRKGASEIGVFVGQSLPAFGRSEADALDFGIVSRNFFRNDSDIRPYIEVRVGLRDMQASGMVPGFQDQVEAGTLFYSGIGVGLEYSLGGGASLHVQLDGAYVQGGLGSTDIMTTEYGVLLGGGWRF